MNKKRFLDSYGGQSTEELIALDGEFRTDSLVLAFEEAITAKRDRGMALSEEEAVVLAAIEALEREVNNGGFRLFFFNSSRFVASFAPYALSKIECPKTGDIVREALRIAGTDDPERLRAFAHYEHAKAESSSLELLDGCDARYYKTGENLASQLFDFIVKNREAIVLAGR
jgi:hypothetical protein